MCFASPPSPFPHRTTKPIPFTRESVLFQCCSMTHVGGDATAPAEFAKKCPPPMICCHQIVDGPCKLSLFFHDANFHLNKTNKSLCDSPLHDSPSCLTPSVCVRQGTHSWILPVCPEKHERGGACKHICLQAQMNVLTSTTMLTFTLSRLGDNASATSMSLSTSTWMHLFVFRMKWCSILRMLHHFIYHQLIVDCCINTTQILLASRSPQQC